MSKRPNPLASEGRCAYMSFDKSVTLSTIFRQSGNDPIQEKFRTALLNIRVYAITQADYDLLLMSLTI